MKNRNINIFLICLCLAWQCWSSCKKAEIVTSTTTDVNLVSYMRQNADAYSEFLKIIDKAGTTDYLNAYGHYTLFAPDNNAIKLYLEAKGGTIDKLTEEEAKNVVRFHLLDDTLYTTSFTDGKLTVPTMYGQYLITGTHNDASGVTRFQINRQALVTFPNVRTGNGILHKIDHVLMPSVKTLAQTITDNANYSIFKQALTETGYMDTLSTLKYVNDTTPRWLTVMAESDAALKAAGINSYSQLKAKYSNTGHPDRDNDSLRMFVGYHIVTDLKYLADIVSAPSHATLTPQEVITSKLKGQAILLNDETFGGVYEPGVEIDRDKSDISATNGVLHELKGSIYIKVRKPVAVYFDVADQPELRAQTSVFRKNGKNTVLSFGSLKDVTWSATANNLTYYCDATSSANYHYYFDYISLPNLRTASGTVNWIEFKTPLLIKGKYKVWLCYRKTNYTGASVQATFDGTAMQKVINCTEYINTTQTDQELEAAGWKRYSGAPKSNSTQCSRLLGTVDVLSTDRHSIRIIPIVDTRSEAISIDMIHFIPVDDVQFLPRFGRDGTLIYQ